MDDLPVRKVTTREPEDWPEDQNELTVWLHDYFSKCCWLVVPDEYFHDEEEKDTKN